jgi:transcription initiation factor TFIID subunit 3
MNQDDFFCSAARVSAAQILRASGIVRARPTAHESFTDILIRVLVLIGSAAKRDAGISGRSEPDLEDVRAALEEITVIPRGRVTGLLEDEDCIDYVIPVDEDDRQIRDFIKWCKGDAAEEMRRIAAMPSIDTDEGRSREDWLSILVRKEERLSSTDKFKGTILDTDHQDTHEYPHILGMQHELAAKLQLTFNDA